MLGKSPFFAAEIPMLFPWQEEKARADLKQKSLSAAEQDLGSFMLRDVWSWKVFGELEFAR